MLLKRSCLLVALFSLCFARGAAADDSYRTARVSDVVGELAVRGDDESDVSNVERNAIIRAGDVIWTDDRGNAELEMERGAWVRMAEDTKLEVRELPPSGEFRLWSGSVYFDVSERVEQPIRLKTPAGDIDILPESVVRVDLAKDDSARISVLSGRAVALTDGGRDERLGSGDRAYLESGRLAESPQRFNRGDLDGFDRYHRGRVDYYAARPLPKDLDEPIIGAYDLEDNGSWVTVENERYWRPRCGPEWRPYSSGYWSFVPGCGYSWIDYEPWGYTTSHYGRWLYRPVYGWLWAPRYTWSPAWVMWSNCDSYFGWCALDPWDRPCHYGRGLGFDIGFGGSNWFVDFNSWSFCDRDRFFFARHHRFFDGGGHRGFFAGRELHLDPGRFHLTRDAAGTFGVPRDHVRGLSSDRSGTLARDRVSRLEDRIPAHRESLIRNRFGVNPQRDRNLVRQASNNVERQQRDRTSHVEDTQLLHGDDARRLIRSPRSGGGGDNNLGSRNGGDRSTRSGDGPGGRDSVFTRNRNGGDGGNGGNKDGVYGRTRGGGDSDKGNGGTERSGRKGEPDPPQPPKPPKNNDNGSGSRDRDGVFRRGERSGDGGGAGSNRGGGDSNPGAGSRSGGPVERRNGGDNNSGGGRSGGSVERRGGGDSNPGGGGSGRSGGGGDRNDRSDRTPGRRSYSDFPGSGGSGSGSPSGGSSPDSGRYGGRSYRDFPGPSGGGDSSGGGRSLPRYNRPGSGSPFGGSRSDSGPSGRSYGGASDSNRGGSPFGGRSYGGGSDSGRSSGGGGGGGGYSRSDSGGGSGGGGRSSGGGGGGGGSRGGDGGSRGGDRNGRR